jgi:xanthine dehydrogenase accessory factor
MTRTIQDPADWLSALTELRARGEPSVLVTLVGIQGSTPRESGSKLLVTVSGITGSIGGGHLELKATEIAREMIRDRAGAAKLESFSLGPALGQCCGGKVQILLEPFVEMGFTVALFGAGHVGKAIVSVLSGTATRVLWIDHRPEQFPAEIPANVVKILTDRPEDEVKDLPAGVAALTMTPSHDLDFTIVEKLLARGDCRYVGMIGSRSKRKSCESRLSRKGVDPAVIRSLRSPIGIDGIDGKQPREIAIAVAAELLLLRDTAERQAAAEKTAAQ